MLHTVSYHQNRSYRTDTDVMKIVSEYDQVTPQSQTADKPVASSATQQSRDTRKTNKAKQPALFPINVIAKLEWTQCYAQQNIEELQNPTMGVTINNESATTEPPSKKEQLPKPPLA